MEQKEVNFILKFLKSKIESLKHERLTKRVELDCLSREIDNLEDMLFKCEREVEKMQGETK